MWALDSLQRASFKYEFWLVVLRLRREYVRNDRWQVPLCGETADLCANHDKNARVPVDRRRMVDNHSFSTDPIGLDFLAVSGIQAKSRLDLRNVSNNKL